MSTGAPSTITRVPAEPAEQPGEPPTDERWQALRETVAAAIEANRTDVQELKELIDATENEDLRTMTHIVVERAKVMSERALHEVLSKVVTGREVIEGYSAGQVEM
jgi:hypothetical protein